MEQPLLIRWSWPRSRTTRPSESRPTGGSTCKGVFRYFFFECALTQPYEVWTAVQTYKLFRFKEDGEKYRVLTMNRLNFTWCQDNRSDTINLSCKLQCKWRRSEWNDYYRKRRTLCSEFKSRKNLFSFHIVPIPLGKVWIQLFSPQLCVEGQIGLFNLDGKLSTRRKTLNSNLLKPA